MSSISKKIIDFLGIFLKIKSEKFLLNKFMLQYFEFFSLGVC